MTSWDHVRLFSGSPCYFATKGLPNSFSFTEDGRKLSLQGLQIGRIDGLGVGYYDGRMFTETSDALVQTEGSLNAYGSDESLRNAVWRTLVGNRTPSGAMAPGIYECLLELPLPHNVEDSGTVSGRGRRTFDHLLRQNKALVVCGKELGSFFPLEDQTDQAHAKESLRALERMFRFHRSRRLIVTDNGYFGLAPLSARKHDYIFLLPGCDVPICARHVQSNVYQVVGACYLHGVMEGEFIKGIWEGKQHLEGLYFS